MSFGDTLRHAYQQASDMERAAASRIAAGVDWVGKQSGAVADEVKKTTAQTINETSKARDWLVQETKQAVATANAQARNLAEVAIKQAHAAEDRVSSAFHQASAIAGHKEKKATEAIKKIYRQARNTMAKTVTGAVTTTCKYAKQARDAVQKKLEEGLQNAAARERENKPPELEKKAKLGVEADRRDYRHYGSEHPPEALEPKAEVKIQLYSKDSRALLYGDEDNNIQVGVVKVGGGVGYTRDFNEGQNITGVYGEAQIAGLTAQAKGKLVHGALEGQAQGEVLSAKASGMLGYVQGKDFNGIKGELGAEANLIKVGGSGQVNITPKTLYDNTLGLAVGLVEPSWSELPAWADHGVYLGAEVEAGVGAALKGSFSANAEDMSFKAGGLIGAGPMAGIYAIFGLK